MTIRIKAGLLAACAFVFSLATPATSTAAQVGYYGACYDENPSLAISAAGHTPVAVGSLTSASLSGLAALFVNSCNWPTSAELNTAISNGLVVIAHDPGFGSNTAPGHTLARSNNDSGVDINFPSGVPFLNGPGGTLDNTSLDNGSSSNHGHFTGTLPIGGQVLATTGSTSQLVTLTYRYGTGRIVYSTIPLGCYLPGGNCDSLPTAAGMQKYAANIIAAYAGPGFTTCSAEGFTGSKLTMCQKICEIDQSPSTLTSLIRLYRAAYREDPPCAN